MRNDDTLSILPAFWPTPMTAPTPPTTRRRAPLGTAVGYAGENYQTRQCRLGVWLSVGGSFEGRINYKLPPSPPAPRLGHAESPVTSDTPTPPPVVSPSDNPGRAPQLCEPLGPPLYRESSEYPASAPPAPTRPPQGGSYCTEPASPALF